MQLRKPTFSIVTITFNAEKVLERTILSIINQTDKDFEYIIIDGSSKDSTLEIVENYSEHIDQIISEPDKGIYDAMNKGLALAKGRFMWFMNAGDEIAQPTTIQHIKSQLRDSTDLIYGEALFVNDEGVVSGTRSDVTVHNLPEKLHWQDFKYGMLVCHQSFIVCKEIAPIYDISNLSADLGYEITSVKRSKEQLYISEPLSRYLEGGVSVQQHRRSLVDRFKILSEHFGVFKTLLFHVYITFRALRN